MTEDERKRARAAAAAAVVMEVAAGMVVGLGTGDSAAHAIRALARRGLRGLRCVPTSVRTAALGRELGLPLCELDELPPELPIDVTIDGADEIDPALRLLKGGGGALLREKLVAISSRRLLIVADTDKLVTRLGERFRLPVEIVPFGAARTLQRIREHFPGALLRQNEHGPFSTDGGNRLVDVPLSEEQGADPQEMHRRLKLLGGVIETGLFLWEAQQVFLGAPDGSVGVREK